jgi:heat shock protein HslJ
MSAGRHVVALLGLGLAGLAQATSLQGSEWQPLRIGGLAVPEDSSAFVQFRSKGRLVGFSGCNRLMAEYRAGEGVIFIGPVAATRMRCAEPVMRREAALANALGQARSYRRDGARLVLFDADGSPGLEMRQTDWD